MITYYNHEKPNMVENTSPRVTLNYNIYEMSESDVQALWEEINKELPDMPSTPDDGFRETHKYSYNQVLMPMGLWTRDGIINAIIRDKYRIDEMEAITNNMAAINAVFMQTLVTEGIVAATKYLKESINDANTARFKEMQEWRQLAKKVASEIIKE